MKKISEMGYSEFLSEVNDYINSLEEPLQRGEADPMTAEEWKAAIKREMVDFDEAFTDEQIGWIVEKLDDDGFVKEEAEEMENKKWYAVQTDRTDDWGTGSYDYDDAVQMLKEQGYGLIAVIDEGRNPSEALCVEEIAFEEV